ncbi:MAG: hypothetical protein LDL51_00480 [Chloroflexi bacterium]|nr:hypothetical protein [Chloroflexota bacterium]
MRKSMTCAYKIPNCRTDFTAGEAKVRHGGVGSHGAGVGEPAGEALFAFTLGGVIQVGGFERATPVSVATFTPHPNPFPVGRGTGVLRLLHLHRGGNHHLKTQNAILLVWQYCGCPL